MLGERRSNSLFAPTAPAEPERKPEQAEVHDISFEERTGRSLFAENATAPRASELFFAPQEKGITFTEALSQVQGYLSETYATLITEDNSDAKEQMKRRMARYLQENRIAVDGMTASELVDALYTEMAEYGFLTKYIFADGIEEIDINSWRDIEIQYSDGHTAKLEEHFDSPEHAANVIRRMLQNSGKVLDNASPIITSRLAKNIRISVIKTPVLDEDAGVAASIRIVNPRNLSKADFVQSGTATEEMLDFLSACLRYGVSICVAGATSSGKTTVAGWLLSTIPDRKRIFTIEDGSRELQLIREHDGRVTNSVVHTQTRDSENERQRIDQIALLDIALRFNPDIICVGEMRGPEANAAQEAARVGIAVLTTIHSNSSEGTYRRMVSLCKRAVDTPDDTFVAKQEGSNTLTVVNRPSDGYERSVSSSLMVVSTAPVSTEFDHALITSAYDYLTSGAAVRLIASGVSVSGSAAELPADITWKSADETIGTVSEDGVFTAVKKGSVEIQLLSGDTVIGSKTLTAVEPNGLKFSKTSINAIYGDSVRLPLIATYNENPVAVCAGDITFELSNSAAGTVEAANNGFAFTGSEASGLRNVTITAMITRDYSISATIKVAMYSANQAIFDFDNATSGDRTFAWTRDVSNAEYLPGGDGETDRYHVIDPSQPMNVTYVFGLDMMTIKVPEKLEPLLSMVAGGDISGITAWDLLLQLAERVSSKTEVTVKFQFDQNVAVDISNLTVSNDYFRLTSASLDENNLLTVKCNFIKQSQAIDPDTANPICILSGVKLSAKDGAQWDADQCLSIENTGSVGYDIYLGANALYNMAKQTSFQEQYGIYPYEEPENTTHPCGGHFYCESYQEFTDRFILDNGSWSGWKTVNGTSYYFVENNALKGIHKVPGLNDESNEYFYQFNETTGACEGKVTGLIEFDGAWYYAINGVAKSGWWNLTDADGNNGYYYFDPETFQGLDGENSSFFPNVTYQFENGKLVKGSWLATDHGKRYYYGPGFVQGKWYTIEGNLYYFNQDGYRYEGLRYVKLRDNHDDPIYWYDFGEDGICHGVYQHTGLFDLNGNTYYTINGMACNGLYLAEDGYYYYFGSVDYTAVKNTRHWVSYPNDTGFAPAFYSFDEDGRMIIDTPDPSKDGIVNEDGELYYYVNGVRFYAGLIQIDGDYYYVNSSCKVVTNQRYWVSKTNDLLPAGFYNFDVDGKMTDAPIPTPDPDPDPNPDPEVKNGIVNEDGELYYYVNGVKTYAGLIQVDGNYYYVNSYCKVITNQRYWVSKTNDLLTAGFYNFGADGKMTDAPIPTPDPDPDPNPDPEVKNGIVSEDGELYYYVNGVKTYAGLIQFDGNYYYVNSYCKVITNQRYWVSKTNDLLPAAFYNFDADGKMTDAPIPTPDPDPDPVPDPEVKNGIVSEDGELYYYVDGVKTYAGLIQIDGDYYYVNSYCKVITSQRYWVSKTNNLLPATFYTFGADGKMVR